MMAIIFALVAIIAYYFIFVTIVKKTGREGWQAYVLAFLGVTPGIQLLFFAYLALVDWPIHQQKNESNDGSD